MKRVLLVVLFLSACSLAQVTTKKDARAPAKMEKATGPTAALLQQEWDAWCTLDAKNAAKYYDPAPGNVFFDLEPLQYRGWAEYQKGAQAFLDTLQSAACKVDEVKIHRAGPAYWTSAIVHLDMSMKSGEKSKVDVRWTSIWEKRGNQWKIVHEHVSAPLPEPEKK